MDSLRKKNSPTYHSVPTFRPLPQEAPRYTRPVARPAAVAVPPKAKPKKSRRPFRWLRYMLWLIFLLALVWVGYFSWKLISVSHLVNQNNSPKENALASLSQVPSLAASLLSPSHAPLRGEEDGRINILLLGRAGEHYPGHDLTDTVMIMSLDTKEKKIALLSLPRDLSVTVPKSHLSTKINAVYQHSLAQYQDASAVIETVEDITRLPIHYFLVIDFSGFEKVIDTLGGINVEVMRDMYDERYPGPNYSYQTFEIKKGWQTLDGATALKYVRERHDDPEGDFGRAKRQQQVTQAVKNKAFSLQTFANAFTLNELLNTLGESVRTNIKPNEIESFVDLAKHMDTQNIANVVVDAWQPDSLLRVSHVQVGPTAMFILVPRVGNWSEVRDLAANLFDLNTIKRRQEAIRAEEASVTVVNLSGRPGLGEKIRRLLKDSLGLAMVEVISSSNTSNVPLEEKSILIDRAGRTKPFSLDEILKKFPVSIGEADFVLPEKASESDIVFIIGQDLKPSLDFEEDSVEDFKRAEDNEN